MLRDDVAEAACELVRIAAERDGLSEELDGARTTLARIAGERDRLVDEGSSLRNDITEIAGELARVASERDDAAREIDGIRASLADVVRERDGLPSDMSQSLILIRCVFSVPRILRWFQKVSRFRESSVGTSRMSTVHDSHGYVPTRVIYMHYT